MQYFKRLGETEGEIKSSGWWRRKELFKWALGLVGTDIMLGIQMKLSDMVDPHLLHFFCMKIDFPVYLRLYG